MNDNWNEWNRDGEEPAAPADAGKEEAAAHAEGEAPAFGTSVQPQGSADGLNSPAPNAGEMPPVYPPQGNPQPGWGALDQQNQWTFNDYGPLNGKPPKEPKPPKHKKEKLPKEKKEASSGRGLKVFAILVSVLFVLTSAGFGGYIVYDLNKDTAAPQNQQPSASTPQINVENPPADDAGLPSAGTNRDGALSGSEIFAKVEPAVVGIVGYAGSTVGYQKASEGSGIVFDSNGYIVTNAHVITDDGEYYSRIEVILPSGESYPATVQGADSDTDLAVLKIEATGLATAAFGDSDGCKVGDRVFVIGNPNGIQFAGSMAGGYISALNRELRVESMSKSAKYIQTDAAINPGNSGGALVNEYGQVIGITSAKWVQTGFEGMGFAIPINDAKPIVDSLIANGYVAGRVKLGITYMEMTEALSELNNLPRGIRVIDFEEDADISKQGIQKGDIITHMDGKEVYDSDTVSAALEGKSPSDTLEMTIYRVNFSTGEGSTITISAILTEKR